VVTLRTAHVALSKRIFRLNQCAFWIVLNFWQRGGSCNRGQRTLAGKSRAQSDLDWFQLNALNPEFCLWQYRASRPSGPRN
jgi:hypothetical protein